MTMTIWYAPRSSAFRSLWALEEIGAPYEKVRVDLSKKETRTPEFLKLNPNGKVPAFRDDDVVLWESMAICDYLAGKFPEAKLLPAEPRAQLAETLKWMHYALATIWPLLSTIGYNRLWRAEDKRDVAAADQAVEDLRAPLAVLDATLAAREYLAGPFSLADLAYSNMALLPLAGVSLDPTPHLKAYVERLKARPAFKRARAIE
jgi:glutathione S-transferase